MKNHITKLISLILALVMLTAFTACTKPDDNTDNNV